MFEELESTLSSANNLIWIHASSAGEFEQAKPIIDAIKKEYQAYKILVTIFSPSGYGVAKRYKYADFVFYLPLDTKQNATRFLNIINPSLVVFVKYDFWYHHLKTIHAKNIPLVLVSAVFRKDQMFFKWYGRFFKQLLHFFQWIFVQDETSLRLLQQHGIQHCSLGGDTRFDRVVEIAQNFTELPYIKAFTNNTKTIVAGSTWPDDEEILKNWSSQTEYKLIIAPHEINKEHIAQISKLFPRAIFYSQLKEETGLQTAQVLIIDNVGMLSRLYHYAHITYIGGGFTKDGIHNTLEAAVYGKPVIFGPNYKKYREAKDLIEAGGGFSFSTSHEFADIMRKLSSSKELYQKTCEASLQYVQRETGATKKILDYVQAKRLLTK